MQKYWLTAIILPFFLLLSFHLTAQERCATEKFESIRRGFNPKLETKDQFEQWMIALLKKRAKNSQRTQATFTIPVVVHIIHNNQSVGSTSNISDAQVLSQIKVLNNDFQRLNADASQTPALFQPVAGPMSIEFVLAKQDPLGNATNGIVRVNGGKSAWNLYEDAELKGKSYWPAEQYLNIWVTNFQGFLGYTQFPVSNVAGLTNSSNDRLTDGIIIHYRAFGSIDDGAFDLESQYNKGRTVTHEVGHFFGLRHIWGDGSSCDATDYVDDTPTQSGSTSNCPVHPTTDCSTPKMFQNYLDYTDDQCMNIFTQGQADRMEIVVQNSPRRASLLTSTGALSPGNFSLDLGILSVQTPTTLACSGTQTPTITIRNFGTTTITQAVIELKINAAIFQTKSLAFSLAPLSQTQVTFNTYNSLPNDAQDFQFKILNVNGLTDANTSNNIFSLTSKTAAQAPVPYLENFEITLTNWNIVNPDDLTTWTSTALPNPNGGAIFIDYFNYENEGALDKIISPTFNVSSATGILLKFKLAHAQYPGNDGDALSVYAFTGCADDLTNAQRVFFKEGEALATTQSSFDYFTPTTSDWQTKYVPLNQFIGSTALRFAFVGRNGYGNNIFIDSVELSGSAITNLSIQKIIEPSLAVCTSSIAPKLSIANLGTNVINGFSIDVTLNGTVKPSQSGSIILNPGEEAILSVNELGLNAGMNNIKIVLTPNGPADSSPSDNTIQFTTTFITNSATIPARENFNNTSTWTFVGTGSTNWEIAPTNYGLSAAFNSFDNINLSEQAWLVSPKLDFTKAKEAILFADFSYAFRSPNTEFVSVAASNNCGKTFDRILYSGDASNLLNVESDLNWTPTAAEDWIKEHYNLNDLVGNENVLLAIRATNFNGNNLYVDNIEFFENDNTTPTPVTTPFQILHSANLKETYLTFNLEEKQTVQVQITSIMGSTITTFTEDNILNQTLTFHMNVVPGIYIFKIRIGEKLYTVRQYMEN